MKDNDIQFKLMLPAELKRRVEDAAAANRRSLSAEIVSALEGAYPPAISMGDYLQNWALPAVHARSEQERDETIQQANTLKAAKAAGLSLRHAFNEVSQEYCIDILLTREGQTGIAASVRIPPRPWDAPKPERSDRPPPPYPTEQEFDAAKERFRKWDD